MNKEEIIALAEKCGWYDCYEFPEDELISFAKAIQDKQRELDATFIRSFGYGLTHDMFDKLADAILENKEQTMHRRPYWNVYAEDAWNGRRWFSSQPASITSVGWVTAHSWAHALRQFKRCKRIKGNQIDRYDVGTLRAVMGIDRKTGKLWRQP